ncbi:MAG: 1-(5-phosphoribosyl)-5-[(5-phosphoribosylamino)methylideneamino]imidazole-4-carboxamide isomerase, partial [Flavobacteriaceae bacterium]|nr:1-(5-phosphoribosyl)-5-[(5-phosphoribosylamino)methylideneamino]imidazole-4-carboxamide isomerase [Flavobacteriaceae bacterium]
SIAVKAPELFLTWLGTYGSEKIILGADAKDRKIAVGGWTETSNKELIPFVKAYAKQGVRYVICTDIARDGMLEGPALDLYKEMMCEIEDINLIASGGISHMKDVERLKAIGCEGAIIGKAIYENRITLKELERFILN